MKVFTEILDSNPNSFFVVAYLTDIDIKLGKIKKYYKLYSYGIIEQKIYDKIKDTSNERARCEYLYLMLFFKTHSAIGHYCRHLYNIVKFIHKERMRCLDKYSQSDKKHKKEIIKNNRTLKYKKEKELNNIRKIKKRND